MTPACLPRARRSSLLPASLALALSACVSSPSPSEIAFAPGAPLSEDEALAAELQLSLSAFLERLQGGEWSPTHTTPDDLERYAFFYKSLMRGARDARPTVLKAYPSGEGSHMLTVAFLSGPPEALNLARIVELEAVPGERGFLFRPPYERHTADLPSRTIGDVTFRYSGALDTERAAAFARFKSKIEGLLNLEPRPLRYDRFESLDALLGAFGLVHDASKCNLLRHDLGFLWDDGERFSTGTGDERYLFGYVRELFSRTSADPEAIFWPYANGVAAYYGGYGLSGESVEVLAGQFRDELERRPSLDLMEEFDKGRGSSVQRHFSNYVLCAFLCREIVERHGEAAALSMVFCGGDGERFFDRLGELLGVTRENFHETILRLIEA